MKALTGLAALLVATSSHAGLWGLTMHSRANCINNESISWDATKAWPLMTQSLHIAPDSQKQDHTDATTMQMTHRSAAICWAEGMKSPAKGKWLVVGQHFFFKQGGELQLVQQENISDCSIYDGWWGDGDEPDHPTDDTHTVIGKSYADVLINFQTYAHNYANVKSDTGLKTSYKMIPLAFQYKPAVLPSGSKVLSYTPMGGYSAKGWTGIKEFFSVDGIGNCSLSTLTMKLTTLQKTLSKSITGDKQLGYLYSVEWSTSDTWMLFECGNRNKNPDILYRMEKIATNW